MRFIQDMASPTNFIVAKTARNNSRMQRLCNQHGRDDCGGSEIERRRAPNSFDKENATRHSNRQSVATSLFVKHGADAAPPSGSGQRLRESASARFRRSPRPLFRCESAVIAK